MEPGTELTTHQKRQKALKNAKYYLLVRDKLKSEMHERLRYENEKMYSEECETQIPAHLQTALDADKSLSSMYGKFGDNITITEENIDRLLDDQTPIEEEFLNSSLVKVQQQLDKFTQDRLSTADPSDLLNYCRLRVEKTCMDEMIKSLGQGGETSM